MDSENLRAVGLMGSSAAALDELESLPTRDSIVKHFLLCWNIVMGYIKKILSQLNAHTKKNRTGSQPMMNPRLKKVKKTIFI